MDSPNVRNLIWDILDKIRQREPIGDDMKKLEPHDEYFHKYLWRLNKFARVETNSPVYGVSMTIVNYYLRALCDDIYEDLYNPNKMMFSDLFYEWFDAIGIDKRAYADCMDVYLIDEIFTVLHSKTEEEVIECHENVGKIIKRISEIKK